MKIATAVAIIGLSVICIAQAQTDSRFDGIWVGNETLTPASKVSPDVQKRISGPHAITIAIAKGGTLLGIIGGVWTARYEHIRRSGNTLTFSGLTFGGGTDCHLAVTLSPDGKTLTEQGNCNYPTTWAVRQGGSGSWPVSWVSLQINGIFHKSK